MKKSDVKIGMKVVPFRKTVPGWEGLDNSSHWYGANKLRQPYLFVIGYDVEEKAWELGIDKNKSGADYFRASDFRPYVEK